MDVNEIFFRIKSFLIGESLIAHVSMYVDQTQKRIVIEPASPTQVKAESGWVHGMGGHVESVREEVLCRLSSNEGVSLWLIDWLWI